MAPSIEIYQSAIDANKQTEQGYVSVSQDVHTYVTLPDVSGTYQTEVGEIGIKIKGNLDSKKQRITIDSELTDGELRIPLENGEGGAYLAESKKRISVEVPSLHRYYPNHWAERNPI